MYTTYEQYLLTLQNRDKYRRLGILRQEPTIGFLDFSTNDYLNLSQHPGVIQAAVRSGMQYGAGSTGSRVLSGNGALYEAFEQTIAQDKHTEASLIFNSGFQANISALSCLLDEKILHAKPIVFFDKFNHASLYQAIFLSQAELCRYRHNDMAHLVSLLEAYKNDPRPKFIVTETVFGMDGDIAPLEHIVALAKAHHAFLYLDEAHATGVFGVHGYGLSTALSLQHIPHIIMGSFSKALGCSGGYIACHSIIRDFLINKAAGFIYSTAPSPLVVGAAFEAWKLVKALHQERCHLQHLGTTARTLLKNAGFDTGLSMSHIISVIVEEEKACLQAKEALLKENILVSSIRPPTVPVHTARLRIALTAKHTLQEVEQCVETLKKVLT